MAGPQRDASDAKGASCARRSIDGLMTLGLLAGGRASRLGGRDKAWLRRNGRAQVEWLAALFAPEAGAVLVSANRAPERYAQAGLAAVADRSPGLGPLGGLDALAQACATPWLFTLPVDVVDVDAGLARLLAGAGPDGAWLVDADGRQPLAALWRVDALRPAVAAAIGQGELAVHALQARLGMAAVRLPGLRLGNLNTPQDLAAAGIEPE